MPDYAAIYHERMVARFLECSENHGKVGISWQK